LGSPAGGRAPVCNRFLVIPPDETVVEVPAGRYLVYAWKGPFWSLDRVRIDVSGGEELGVVLSLAELPLLPTGTLSADLHLHGPASHDSFMPEEDRVYSFAAAELQVVAATDHDVVHDYGPMIEQLGLDDRLSSIVGV